MLRLTAAILLALAAPAFADTAVAPPASVTAPAFDLQADVERALRSFDVPGMAVAIVKDGKVIAARGFGVKKRGAPDPVDSKTLFEIASNSKAFTSVVLAQLVDEGKLAWDDPVVQHLPDFQMYDPYVTREMTVRDLLVHRSGLGLGAGDLLWWPTTNFGTDEIIARLRHVRPATSFRSAYAYDNLLYIVAGKLIAAKTGKPWGEAVRERILHPLGMDGTATSLAAMAASGDMATPHSRIGEHNVPVKQIPVGNAVGAVGIDTNAEDIAKWMNALLAHRVTSEKQARELWTPQTIMRISEPPPALAATKPNFLAYALGFQVRDYHGRRLAMHGGALQGFYSRVVMVPDEKLGIAILTNAENSASMNALSYRILDQFLNVPASDWIKLFADQEKADHEKELARLAKESPAHAAKSGPSLPLSAYDGEYTDAWYGTVTIKPVNGKHVLTFTRSPDLTGEMEHYQYDTFIVRWKERNFNADAYVTFSLNPDGSIDHVKMKPISKETDFSYDFQDLLLTPATKP